METVIKNLVELAKEYESFGKKYKLPSGFTELGDGCRVYFENSRSTCSIEFDSIEISLFRKAIVLPFNATNESLSLILNKNQANLFVLNEEYSNKPKQEQDQVKLKRIQELENELNELKDLA